MTKQERAKDITIKIFKVILEEINGFSKEEIKERQLAEDCEYSTEFERIHKIIKSQL